jgi:hypothetical protein
MPISRNLSPAIKQSRRDQLAVLQSAAQQAITEYSDVVINEKEILRFANLAIDSLRRGRHDISPEELLRNPQQTKEFMYNFVSKRTDLGPLKSPMAVCEPQVEVGEKPETALVIEDEHEDCVLPEAAPATAPATPTPGTVIPAKTISEEQVQKAITSWIWTNVDPAFWLQVMEEVIEQVYRLGQSPSTRVATGSLEEIIEAHRPVLSTIESNVLVGQLVEWLLNWTMNLNRNPHRVCGVIEKGFAQARRELGKIA